MNIFQERLKLALDMKGWKAADLADRTQIPKSSISQYLNGLYTPKANRASVIALALNVNERWLSGLENDPALDGATQFMQLYSQLDHDDQMKIQGRIEEMLEQTKYKEG